MRIERRLIKALSVFACSVLFSTLTFAQVNNATLDVIVRDPSGALVNKAQVQLVSNAKPQLAQTNQKGEARFTKLPPGRYQIHIEAVGFKSQDIDGVALAAGPNRTEVSLEIDVIKADVNVDEEAVVRNTNPNGAAFTNVMTAEQGRPTTFDFVDGTGAKGTRNVIAATWMPPLCAKADLPI